MRCRHFSTPALVAGLCVFVTVGFGESTHWPAPKLTHDNYRRWLGFIRPAEKDLKWRKVRWHKTLSAAAAESRELERPILLWTMNGHPCGET